MIDHSVKIVATIGPASSSPERLEDLIRAGVNLFRFNFAHETREEHAKRIALVRQLSEKLKKPIGTLADISGPKIRLGKLASETVNLEPGKLVTLNSTGGDGDSIPVRLPKFDEYVYPGDPIYLADGTRKLIAEESGSGMVHARVEVGGPVCSYKGINLPHLRKPLPAVSEKDLLDSEAALQAGIDWLGLSFVSHPDDLIPIHDLMKRINIKRPVIAKLERRQALDRLDEIVQAFDGVMVARGDLGIEVEFEKVPVIQDRILRAARKYGKPAIVATQILTSMVNNPRPTRAEATDIAYAVAGGADALMLSEETAIGNFPTEAVGTIIKVAKEIESSSMLEQPEDNDDLNDAMAIAHTAAMLAKETQATAILVPTHSGNAVRAVARFRPGIPIVVVTDKPHIVGELTLYRGVHPQFANIGKPLDSRIVASLQYAEELGMSAPGTKFVIVGGVPAGSGNINLLMVHTVS
jgi:pyruvate kinase